MKKSRVLWILVVIILLGIGAFLAWIKFPALFSKNPVPNAPRSISQEELAERIAESTPQDEKALLARAEQFFNYGAFTFAEKDAKLLLQRNPNNRAAYDLLHRIFVRTRNFVAAEKNAEQGLQIFPNDSQLLVALGSAYVQEGKFSEARSTFAALPENSAEKNFFTGIMATLEGRYDEAQGLLQNAQSSATYGKRSEILLKAFHDFGLFPDGSNLHRDILLAKALNDVEMYELSLQLSKKVLAENTQYRDAWMVNGISYLFLERYEFARTAFEKAFEVDPASPIVAYYLGFTLKRLGDTDGALNFFTRAKANGFTPLTALLRETADAYYLQQNYDLALKTFEEMLPEQDLQIGDFVRPLHIALDLQKNSETGLRLANAAVSKFPNEALAWNLRGWAYLEKGDLKNAATDLNKAVKLNPDLIAAYLNLGRVQEQEGDKAGALGLYKKVYEADAFGDFGKMASEKYNALLNE